LMIFNLDVGDCLWFFDCSAPLNFWFLLLYL
jgi:hypothetical protein